jgi:peptidoglycan/LPS O-acetylase OafA/YrhL
MGWRAFMTARAIRFFPALAIGVALAVSVHWWLYGPSVALGIRAVLHLLLIPDPTSSALFPLNGVLWTLLFEIVLNAGHAAVVRRLSTALLVALVTACGCAWAWIAVQTGNWGGGWNWATIAGGVARVGWSYGVGLLLYRLSAAGRLPVPVLPASVPIAAAVALLLAPSFGLGAYRFALPLFLLLPLVVLFAAHASITPAGARVAGWFGELSYPLYTIHSPLLLLAVSLVGGGAPASWTAIGCAIVLAAAAATRWCELPIRAWLKRQLTHDGSRA